MFSGQNTGKLWGLKKKWSGGSIYPTNLGSQVHLTPLVGKDEPQNHFFFKGYIYMTNHHGGILIIVIDDRHPKVNADVLILLLFNLYLPTGQKT